MVKGKVQCGTQERRGLLHDYAPECPLGLSPISTARYRGMLLFSRTANRSSTYFLFLLCFLVPSAASDTLRSPQIWREMQYGKACRVLVFAQPAHRQRENVLFLRCLSFPLRVLICWRSDRAYKTAPGPIRRISRWCQPFLDPGATHESPRTDHRERTKSRPVLQHITRISRDGLSAAHP